VLVGDPSRSYFPAHRFQRVAAYWVPVSRELEDAEIKLTAVWRLVC
jgi:predicted nicotinamide N-methyase